MKRSLLAIFCGLLLLSGCDRRAPEIQPPSPSQPTQETAVPASEPPKPSGPLVTSPSGLDGLESLTDGDPATGVQLPEGSVLTIRWETAQAFDGILLEGLSDSATVRIESGDFLLYQQDILGENRWCFTGQQDAEELTFTFSGPEQTLGEITLISSKETTAVSAYLPLSTFQPSMADPEFLAGLDRVIVNTGCYWQEDGSLTLSDGLTDAFQALKTAAPDLSLWCTVNPQGALIREDRAGASIDTTEKRAALIDCFIALCEENGLDGVDIDWEFPEGQDWEHFSSLLAEGSAALKQAGFSLSAAFSPKDVELSPQAVKVLPLVHIMAYDQFDEVGYHATYTGAQEAVSYFTELGFRPDQLILGVPAYGRPLDGSAAWPLYRDNAEALSDGANLLNGAFYNSPQLAKDKVLLARQEGLEGVFLYHLGCDMPQQDGSLRAALQEASGK